MMGKAVTLTSEQRRKLEELWFVYGNHGPKSTLRRHRFIQGFLKHGFDYRRFYKPDKEVLEKVDKILATTE